MQAMPWRILVLVDVGVDAGRARVVHGGIDSWLGSLGVSVDLPGGRSLALDRREAFTPAAVRAALDGAGPTQVDAILHSPAFQRLESAWRGLALLLEHAKEAAEVEVLPVSRRRLAARFRSDVFDPELRAADPLTLVIADFDFSHKTDDLALLAELTGMAKVLQAPIVAGASAGFFDLRFLIQAIHLPDLLQRLTSAAHQNWRTFQATEPARWLALTINRWLQRSPYTEDSGGHPEAASESNPDGYLWGRGVWLIGAAVARSVKSHGHALDLAGTPGGAFGNLATRSYPATANVGAALAVEAPISETQVLELSRVAFTPIIGPLRRDLALIPIAVTAFRMQPGKLTVEGTLPYQIFAGRLAQWCGKVLDALPSGSAEGVSFLKSELLAHLGNLAGETPDEAVTVTPGEMKTDEGPAPIAEVKVKPAITLEGKSPEFEFVLPLRG
jgi:type VI secretion system ImpC/EvpB family protein